GYRHETSVNVDLSGATCPGLPPSRHDVTPTSTPSLLSAPRRTIQFDPTPRIRLLHPNRVTSPPKQSDEESRKVIRERAKLEYWNDFELQREISKSKAKSFNAYLHAAFPVDEDEKGRIHNSYRTDERRNEGVSCRKRTFDVCSTDSYLGKSGDSMHKKARYNASRSCEHPEFEAMRHNDWETRFVRTQRWKFYYGSESEESDDDLEDVDESEESEVLSNIISRKHARTSDEENGDDAEGENKRGRFMK
ncbi:hypothetical protein BG015_005639, partial [Linnemannia schmuckeri]